MVTTLRKLSVQRRHRILPIAATLGKIGIRHPCFIRFIGEKLYWGKALLGKLYRGEWLYWGKALLGKSLIGEKLDWGGKAFLAVRPRTCTRKSPACGIHHQQLR